MSQSTVVVGRPPKYVVGSRLDRYIAKLIGNRSALTAQKILNAGPKSKLRTERDLKIVPDALCISYPTLLKIAQRNKVELTVGRPAIRVQSGSAVA